MHRPGTTTTAFQWWKKLGSIGKLTSNAALRRYLVNGAMSVSVLLMQGTEYKAEWLAV